jgi:hypothetical protein
VSEAYQIQFLSNTKVTRIPPDVTYEMAGIKYVSTYTERNNSLLVTRKLAIQRAGPNASRQNCKTDGIFIKSLLKICAGRFFMSKPF